MVLMVGYYADDALLFSNRNLLVDFCPDSGLNVQKVHEL